MNTYTKASPRFQRYNLAAIWVQYRLIVLITLVPIQAMAVIFLLDGQLLEVKHFLSASLGPTWWIILAFICLFVATVLTGWFKHGDLKAELEEQADALRQMALVGTFLGIGQGLVKMGDQWLEFSQALNTSVYVYIALVVMLWINEQVKACQKGTHHGH